LFYVARIGQVRRRRENFADINVHGWFGRRILKMNFAIKNLNAVQLEWKEAFKHFSPTFIFAVLVLLIV
jgi:hypothetical protein